MPTYHVEMLEGRSLEQKKKLVEAITRVSVEILGGQPDSVDVLITDIKRENWATSGKPPPRRRTSESPNSLVAPNHVRPWANMIR